MSYENQIRADQALSQAALAAQGQVHQANLGRGYPEDCGSARRETKPLMIEVAKTIVVTMGPRPLSARVEREFREELSGKIAQGYRVKALVDTGRGVEIRLEKYEPWTLDELMSDINAKLKGE